MEAEKKTSAKQALKALRGQRKTRIDRARKAIKTQTQAIQAIRKALADGGLTVPELARATRLTTAAMMIYIATLKKYGIILEGAKDGDYLKYELAGE